MCRGSFDCGKTRSTDHFLNAHRAARQASQLQSLHVPELDAMGGGLGGCQAFLRPILIHSPTRPARGSISGADGLQDRAVRLVGDSGLS